MELRGHCFKKELYFVCFVFVFTLSKNWTNFCYFKCAS